MFASVVHLSHKNPMGGVCGRRKIFPLFPRLRCMWGCGAVFESSLAAARSTYPAEAAAASDTGPVYRPIMAAWSCTSSMFSVVSPDN